MSKEKSKQSASKPLLIGELARIADCKVQTIRYYEQIGILPGSTRTQGGHRLYGPQEVQRLRFVRRSRDLGFSLEEVRNLLSMADNREGDCGAVDKIASRHLTEVREKIKQLGALEKELQRMVTGCRRGKVADCRIINALSTAGNP